MLLEVFGSEGTLDRMVSIPPIGRIGRPEEIADAVVAVLGGIVVLHRTFLDRRWRSHGATPLLNATGQPGKGFAGGATIG
jgi:hypothetical protein